MLPVVAIVGRPNVGKSSIFNRLVGKRQAIESPISGTTRDQISERVRFSEYEVILVDTGGLEWESQDNIEADVQRQALLAVEGADVVVFVLDVRSDPTADDFHAASILRKSGKSCVMVANKCDNLSKLEEKTFNLYEMGFGPPVAVSAIHAVGLDELKSKVEDHLKKLGCEPSPETPAVHESTRITFIGRPNVGKSSLVNALFGKEKVIVSDIPGTTRDAIEVPFEYENTPFVLVDTAGLRRRGKVEKGIEKYSVLRSFQAIEDSDVAVLVLDGSEGVRAQDMHACEFILQQHKGLIVTINKIDLFEDFDRSKRRLENILRHRMAFVPWAPVVFVSALKRKNLFKILDLAIDIEQQRKYVLDPKELQFWLEDAVNKHRLAGSHGKYKTEILSIEQLKTRHPRFLFKVKHPQYLHFSYKRYLENSLRERFGFVGTSIQMIFEEASTRSSRRKAAKDRKQVDKKRKSR